MKLLRELIEELLSLPRWQTIGIVVGVLGLVFAFIFWRFPFSGNQITIVISSPYMNEQTGLKLQEVRGGVSGEVQSDYRVLVGHRAANEQQIAMHADRCSEVFADKSFMASDISLGSDSEGAGVNFEIIALVVRKDTLEALHLVEGDNPLTTFPDHLAKSVTFVRRVR